MAAKKGQKDKNWSDNAGWIGFISVFMSIFALVAYSKNQDEAILFFAFGIVLLSVGLPPIIDFIKSTALKGQDLEIKGTADWKKAMDRIENLEALMCRLDVEINSQLEQTLSAGKISIVENAADSKIPTVFLNVSSALAARYQVLQELGRGGMGVVFHAHDKQLNEQVAIKVLSPLLSNNAEALERLKREVSAARRVTHPNVIRIHDITESNGLHFVSMEYFSGLSLKELIKRDGPYSFVRGAQIALQICEGLESAHQNGVIHRDLKSQNIIVNDHGHAKIIDFGLASTAHMEGMTATGLIMGTPEYMAPEQVAGKKVDERADLYSLGILLFELFVGHVPFKGDSAIAVGFKQLKEEPPVPSSINSQLPAEFDSIIARLLQKDPAKRYRSVYEVKKDLENLFASNLPGGKEAVAIPKAAAQTARN